MYNEILERIATALDERGVPYMVIGGQAVLLYGEPRLTRDVDITLWATFDQFDTIAGAADMAGLDLLVDPETFTRQTMVLPCQDRQSGVRVDFAFAFSPYEHEAIQRAQAVVIGSASVRFVSRDDLIVHKVVAGRPRDLEDVRSILLKRPTLDEAYIRRWLGEYGEALDQPLVERFNKLLDQARNRE